MLALNIRPLDVNRFPDVVLPLYNHPDLASKESHMPNRQRVLYSKHDQILGVFRSYRLDDVASAFFPSRRTVTV